VRRGTLGELAQHYDDSGPPKGEITLVIGPPGADETATTGEQVDALLREALVNSSVRDAAAEVAAMTGWPKRDVYQRALSIEKDTV
jgi:16S rRNA (cytidine1402-2'-O)-methyltransferase